MMRPARREVAALRAKLDAVDLTYPPAPAVPPTSRVGQEHHKLNAVNQAHPPTPTAGPRTEGGARAGAGAAVTRVAAGATAMEDGPPAKGDAMSDAPAPGGRHDDSASDSLASQIHDTLHRFSRWVAAEGGRADHSLAPSEHHHDDLRRRPSRVAAQGGRVDLGMDSAKAKGPDAREGASFGARLYGPPTASGAQPLQAPASPPLAEQTGRGEGARQKMTRRAGESNKRGHDAPYQASAHASAPKQQQTGDGAAYGFNWLASLFGPSSADANANADSDAAKDAHRAALRRAGIWFFSPSMHTCTGVRARARPHTQRTPHSMLMSRRTCKTVETTDVTGWTQVLGGARGRGAPQRRLTNITRQSGTSQV